MAHDIFGHHVDPLRWPQPGVCGPPRSLASVRRLHRCLQSPSFQSVSEMYFSGRTALESRWSGCSSCCKRTTEDEASCPRGYAIAATAVWAARREVASAWLPARVCLRESRGLGPCPEDDLHGSALPRLPWMRVKAGEGKEADGEAGGWREHVQGPRELKIEPV